jgi:AcrR family transcriptional regulator
MALRDPDKTRGKILEVAASMFHMKGYKGTSLSDILGNAEISKGALYHHFSNKQELLYAVVDEIFSTQYLSRWQSVLEADEPLEEIALVLESMAQDGTQQDMCNGCPVHNLSAELSSLDEGLRQRVDNIFCNLYDIVKQAVVLAKEKQQISENVDEERVTLLFMTGLNGIPQLVKSCQDRTMFTQLTAAIADYIRSFKIN